jgi:Family of unknown function (DUF5684)
MTSHFLMLLAQGEQQGGNQTVISLVTLVLIALVIAGFWKVFTKAGQPGWGCLIPIYNAYLLCKIAGKPGWWLLLLLIPLLNIVIAIIITLGVAENFGKGIGFGLGLIFFPFIFYPILGFGGAEYGTTRGVPITS